MVVRVSTDRREEIAANLTAVREHIATACAAAGRTSDEITLVAVTKTHPPSDVMHLAALGVTDVGENRDQEAAEKAAAVGPIVRWHFVGQLQRNKCKSVVTYADLVQSVDSVRLVHALDTAAAQRGRPLDVLVQVSIDGDPSRGGAGGELDQVLAAAEAAAALRLRGLMAVAPLDWEPTRAFARLAEIAERVRLEYPHATVLSAGMSGDYEQAINYGATHVRLGNALLGNRPALL
jgi:pyridoxal phosphate enzyme (YggS family)